MSAIVLCAVSNVASSVGDQKKYACIAPVCPSIAESSNSFSLVESISKFSGDFDFIRNPDCLLFLFYFFVLFRCVSKVWLGGGCYVAEKVAQAQRHRDDLEFLYDSTVKTSEQMLLDMFESSAYVAEWTFGTRARNFEKFLEHVSASPEILLNDRNKGEQKDLLQDWCNFLLLWFEIFEQCCVNPVKEPNRLTEPVDIKYELTKLKGVQSSKDWKNEFILACHYSAQVLSANEVDFKAMFKKAVAKFEHAEKMQSKLRDSPPFWINFGRFRVGVLCPQSQAALKHQASADKFQRHDDDYPLDLFIGFIHITILSTGHFLLFFSFLCSLVLLVLEIWLEKSPAIGILVTTQLCLIFGMMRISATDEFARLVQEVRELTQASELVNIRHYKLEKFCRKLRKLDYLWCTRTLPCLELMGDLCDEVHYMKSRHRVPIFTRDLVEALTYRIEGMGAIDLWMVDDDESAQFLELYANAMHEVSQAVIAARQQDVTRDAIVERIRKLFCVIVVRVKSASGLTNKTSLSWLGGLADPYCTVKTNEANEQSTTCIENTLDPAWDQEFCIAVNWADNVLELHVWSDCSPGVNHGEDRSLGYVHLNFRDVPSGQWHAHKKNLMSVKKRTEKKSELTFEFYWAEHTTQLYED